MRLLDDGAHHGQRGTHALGGAAVEHVQETVVDGDIKRRVMDLVGTGYQALFDRDVADSVDDHLLA